MFRAYGYPELAHGFRLSLEVSGLRPTTIRNYTADARKFVEHYLDVPPSEVTPMHIRQYLALLKKRVSAKTVYEVPTDLEAAIAAFVSYYNYQRYHMALGNVTPADVLNGRRAGILQRRREVQFQTIERRRRYNRTLRELATASS